MNTGLRDRDDARTPLRTAISQLEQAVAGLPACEDAAKLARLVLRLKTDLREGADVQLTVCRLAAATHEVLVRDRWVQLDQMAHMLKQWLIRSEPGSD
jgi:hypothetical protein